MDLRQSLGLVVMGVTVGAAAALAGTRALTVSSSGSSDPATFVAVVILRSGVVLLACWIPARRATRVRPLVALRYE